MQIVRNYAPDPARQLDALLLLLASAIDGSSEESGALTSEPEQRVGTRAARGDGPGGVEGTAA